MASVLKIQLGEVEEIKRRLDVTVGDDGSERTALEDGPHGPFRLLCAVLLHKAQMHIFAVLVANENNNLHSLAVQMRPVLECAGQIKLVIHNLLIEPEHIGDVDDYFDRDYLGTLNRATKGQMSREQLLARIAEIRKEFDLGPLSRIWNLNQEDKVAHLYGGKAWIKHLSKYFSHGEAAWKGYSWQGGVRSINTVEDEFTFAGFMDYLANQVAVMNAYAALEIPSKKALGDRSEIILYQLQKVRAEIEKLRGDAVFAIQNPNDREPS